MSRNYWESLWDSLPHPQKVSKLHESLLLSRIGEGALRLNDDNLWIRCYFRSCQETGCLEIALPKIPQNGGVGYVCGDRRGKCVSLQLCFGGGIVSYFILFC